MKIGFDNAKYLQMQSQHIRERIAQFDNKLYLEFGGKLFDDYHASRVLPGFEPDSKLQMLLQLKEQAEIVIVISAQDIISSKVRGDYGITYDLDVLRLIDAFQGMGLFVGSVCVTMYTAAPEVEAFEHKLNSVGVRTFRHYKIPGYPNDVARIVSDEGYGKNDYIETQRPLVVITAPGPLLGAASSALLNALKKLAGIDQEIDLVSARAIEPIQTLKTNYLGSRNPRLHTDEILIALSSSAAENETAAIALRQLSKLKGCDMHSTVILSSVDTDTLKRLGMYLTCEPAYEQEDRKYHKL